MDNIVRCNSSFIIIIGDCSNTYVILVIRDEVPEGLLLPPQLIDATSSRILGYVDE